MKRIKYGRLYWLQLEAADIDSFFLVRLLRKFKILYIPFTLRNYDELYLREDRSKYSRRLINHCRKHGIVTYVVQEGPIYHSHQAKWSHLPLYADIFLCPDGDYDMWVSEGMPKERIKTYSRQKKTSQYNGIFFLDPFITWDESKSFKANRRNAAILKKYYDMFDEDVLFKPADKNSGLMRPFIPPHRIAAGSVQELIQRYDNIYCFTNSPVIDVCRQMGKSCHAIEIENLINENDINRETLTKVDSNRDEESKNIAILGAFVIWNDLAFTWRKDYYNVSIFNHLAELEGIDCKIKPHYAHAKLITPFLPPENIVWDDVESLIIRSDNIYCYWDSSVRDDCAMLGKRVHLLGESVDDTRIESS